MVSILQAITDRTCAGGDMQSRGKEGPFTPTSCWHPGSLALLRPFMPPLHSCSSPFPSVVPSTRPIEVERRPKSKLPASLSFPTGQRYYPFMALLRTVTFTISRHRKVKVFTNGPKLPAATHLFSHHHPPILYFCHSGQGRVRTHGGSSSVLRKATADQTPVRGKVRVSGH